MPAVGRFCDSTCATDSRALSRQLLTFNDDIQGTAAVAVGAILGAVKVTGKSLKDQQIVMFGAGSAGIGVADGLRAAMKGEGLSEEEARSRFWFVDRDGLLHSGRKDLSPEQRVTPSRTSACPDGREVPTDMSGLLTLSETSMQQF